ncbi:hypothetical protein EON77_13215, partial [bacterium]
MIDRLDLALIVSTLVSAAVRTLPLTVAIWILTRDRWSLGARTKAILWWLVPTATLLALLLPPLVRLPLSPVAALALLAVWLGVALVRLGGEIRWAIRLRRIVDGAVPLN